MHLKCKMQILCLGPTNLSWNINAYMRTTQCTKCNRVYVYLKERNLSRNKMRDCLSVLLNTNIWYHEKCMWPSVCEDYWRIAEAPEAAPTWIKGDYSNNLQQGKRYFVCMFLQTIWRSTDRLWATDSPAVPPIIWKMHHKTYLLIQK